MTGAVRRVPFPAGINKSASGRPATLASLALLAGVLAIGWHPLCSGLRSAGWGLLWLPPLHFLADATDSGGWRRLLRDDARRPGILYFAWVASLRDATGALLPIVGVLAPLVGVRLLQRRGIHGATALAGVAVESALSLISQAGFLLSASTLSAMLLHAPVLGWALWPPALLALAVGLFLILLQRQQQLYRRIVQMAVRLPVLRHRLRSYPQRLFTELSRIHRDRGTTLICVAWQTAALVIGTLELWLMLRLAGQPTGFPVPLVLMAASKLSRSLGFAVPASLGVQEGVFAGVAFACGLPASVGLELSLLSRCRDLLFGLPLGLLWWLHHSGLRWHAGAAGSGVAPMQSRRLTATEQEQ